MRGACGGTAAGSRTTVFMTDTSSGGKGQRVRSEANLLELLDLEVVDRDLFRAGAVLDDPFSLYGGQVAAQALRAAGLSVPHDRMPHSLHGYFLRGGDAAYPTVFRVYRDRDGRSFSARRVVAIQHGEVIFTMSASFQVHEPGADLRTGSAPRSEDPESLEPIDLPRLVSMEGRLPVQPFTGNRRLTRVWSRCIEVLPDDQLWHAAVLTYLSDGLTGLAPLEDDEYRSGASLDHAVWFHRPARLDDWVLLDLEPGTAAGGRGWYTGTLHDRNGTPVASLAQENLFRAGHGGRPGART
jgi:acyl-CoA thioesterase-2